MPSVLLSNGQEAQIDHEDSHLLGFLWYAAKRRSGVYPARMDPLTRKPVYLHHEVLPDCPPGHRRDHENGNTLDCRRENLRIVSHQANIQNHSRVGGVRLRRGKWQAYAADARGQVSLGVYPTREEALKVRLRWEIDNWGIHPRRLPIYQEYGLVRE